MMKNTLTTMIAFLSVFAVWGMSYAADETKSEGLISRLGSAVIKAQQVLARPVLGAGGVSKVETTAKPVSSVTAKPAVASQSKPKSVDNMTNKEMLERLNEELEEEGELFSVIPGLGAQKTADGQRFFTFNGTKISDLETGALRSLLTRVQQNMARLRADRISRQMESVRAGQRAQEAARNLPKVTATPQVPAQPPRLPVVPKEPPKVPRTPPSPPPIPPRNR